jgi:hypothetical protein
MRELIDQLMQADDAPGLDFCKFAEHASEEILYADTDACESVQIILAVLRGDDELAMKMAERLREPLRNLARELLEKSIYLSKE